MEIVIIVIAIVFSIWSEVNKAKKEKELDFDFSELSSIEDFVKKDNNSDLAEVAYTPPSNDFANAGRGRKKKKKSQRLSEKSRDDAKSAFERTNHDRVESRKDVNYDELPALTDGSAHDAECLFPDTNPATQPQPSGIDFKINRSNLVQAFIMSEVLKRYDINRIYERIPGVRKDTD